MARTYKRDKNGKFASGGSSSTGRSAASSRSRASSAGVERTGNKTRTVRNSEIFGAKRSGNKVKGVSLADQMAAKTAKNTYGHPNHRAAGTTRRGNTVKKSRKVR